VSAIFSLAAGGVGGRAPALSVPALAIIDCVGGGARAGIAVSTWLAVTGGGAAAVAQAVFDWEAPVPLVSLTRLASSGGGDDAGSAPAVGPAGPALDI
jgi:hypothetical protein